MPSPVIDHTVSSGPQLWPHQQELVSAAARTLATEPRTTGVMACGLGKTRAACEVAYLVAADDRVLIVAPTIDLVGQILRDWRDYRGAAHLGRVVAVCSDDSVLLDRDGQPLVSQPTMVTTDPQQLTDFTKGPGRVTVACTYQSLPTLAAAHADHGLPPWRMMIIDEAHRSAGAVGKTWGIVHNDVALPAERRLYLTATPLITGETAISMDDRKIYGPICKSIPFSRGIELGMLADYRLIVAVATSREVRALAEEETHFRVGRSAVSAAMLARQIAVLRAAREHDIRNLITFHHRVTDARWFASTLPAVAGLLDPDERPAGPLWAGHVHGGQSGRERREVLERLRTRDSGLTVVSNARVLTEGVDAPDVDGVAFLDPRESVIDIIQGLGRAMRTGGRTDKVASVIVPLLLDDGDDPEEALLGTKFGPVLRVSQALRATDDTLGRRLDSARWALGARDNSSLDLDRRDDSDPHGVLPDWLSISGIPVPPDFARAISVRIVRSASSGWAEGTAACAAYLNAHGDLEPPRGWTTAEGLPLYSWLEHQKARHRDGRMTPQETAELERLGIVWNKNDRVWGQFLADLITFREEHGHLDVPQKHETPDGRPLGVQVTTRRTNWEELGAERQAELLELGFIRDRIEHYWAQGFTAWLEFKKEHGHPVVPRAHTTASGVNLGQWRITQLQKLRAGDLPPERANRITANQLHLNGRELHELRHIQALRDYRQAHGHTEVPYDHVTTDGLTLGSWLGNQRRNLRNNTISADLAREFSQLGVRAVVRKLPRRG
ncbi:Helicase associated domain protein [Streptomyces sp. NBC_01433]|uniref:DEAD/DEAH box helicase n=1 Tax=Streptomyces sp. NBC_01433 TaxID=2903864 RepID=UPI002255D6DA|nr:DEAD/DEAH box helicase [Streptomyces sp. NBC_01433]MCX4682198.1 Helicase associated domain protein [Streptomyces sp. NBC_01433]